MLEARKLAAILFADVVGYSRLMGEDEAGTARAVRELFKAEKALRGNEPVSQDDPEDEPED